MQRDCIINLYVLVIHGFARAKKKKKKWLFKSFPWLGGRGKWWVSKPANENWNNFPENFSTSQQSVPISEG